MKISYSQVNQYATCPEQFRLERVVRAPSIPSWPAIGGNAVHTITEVDDWWRHGGEPPREIAHIKTFDDALDYQIALALERQPDFTKSDWHVGGRVSKDWPNKENEDWWRQNGEVMRRRWSSFIALAPWDLYVDDFGPAIEVAVSYETPDGDEMRGFIDRIFQDRESKRLIIVDIKSGQAPKSPRQLGFYKQALSMSDLGYPEVNLGTFWMARTGSTTEIVDLTPHTADRLNYQAHALHQAREAGIFIANPGTLCSSCSVRNSCYEMHPESTPVEILPWSAKEE